MVVRGWFEEEGGGLLFVAGSKAAFLHYSCSVVLLNASEGKRSANHQPPTGDNILYLCEYIESQEGSANFFSVVFLFFLFLIFPPFLTPSPELGSYPRSGTTTVSVCYQISNTSVSNGSVNPAADTVCWREYKYLYTVYTGSLDPWICNSPCFLIPERLLNTVCPSAYLNAVNEHKSLDD
jgi:hypothetical protein